MKFKYPKIAGFIIAAVAAYIIFSNDYVKAVIGGLNSFGYLGAFIAGMFYTLGFTSPFATGFFIDLNVSNIFLAGILGGMGALISDMLIFSFIRGYFMDEFKMLGKEKPAIFIERMSSKIFGKMHNYLLYALAALLIASPLPDEAGITILAGMTKIKQWIMAIISIIFNTAGILILLSI